MKYLFLTLFLLISSIGFSGCNSSEKTSAKNLQVENLIDTTQNREIKIKIANQTFDVILENNPTTNAFIKKLPLECDMLELNGNEKYFYLSDSLPTNSSKPRKIRSGDLMLYGDNCLVIFYKDFETNYSYTRLGQIKNPENLAEIVGNNDIHAIFSK